MFDGISFGFYYRDFLLNIRIVVFDLHNFACCLDRCDRRLDVMREFCDEFLFAPVGRCLALIGQLQFFAHAVERFGESAEIIVLIHLERHIEIALRYTRCKIGQLVERPDIEVPDNDEEDNAGGVDDCEHRDELALRSPEQGFVLFCSGIKCDLALDHAVFHVIENRHVFLNEVAVY